MKGLTRSFTTLAGVVAAGALIWFVPHFHRWSNGGYWAGMTFFALAGLVLGLAQLRSREGKGKASFLLVFVPVLVVAGWVTLASQPRSNWFRDHARSWSGDIGLGHVVHNLGEHVAVLAFALGLVFGLTFELAMVPKRKPKVVYVATPPAAAQVAPPEAEAAPAEEPTIVENAEAAPPERQEEPATPG